MPTHTWNWSFAEQVSTYSLPHLKALLSLSLSLSLYFSWFIRVTIYIWFNPGEWGTPKWSRGHWDAKWLAITGDISNFIWAVCPFDRSQSNAKLTYGKRAKVDSVLSFLFFSLLFSSVPLLVSTLYSSLCMKWMHLINSELTRGFLQSTQFLSWKCDSTWVNIQCTQRACNGQMFPQISPGPTRGCITGMGQGMPNETLDGPL